MDTKRLIIAIALSFAVLLLWQYVFVPKTPETRPVSGPGVPAAPDPATAGRPAPAATVPAPAEAAGEPTAPLITEEATAAAEERITIETSLYTAVWSNRGGVLRSWRLQRHLDDGDQPLELVPAIAEETGLFPFSLWDNPDPFLATLEGLKASPLNAALYKVEGRSLKIKDGEKGELRFRYSDGLGLEVEKILVFHGGRYDFDTAFSARRNGQAADIRVLWGPGFGNPTAAELKQRFGAGGGMSVLASGKVYHQDERKYKPETSVYSFADWAAYDDNYFTALFIPAAATGSAALAKFDVDKTALFFLMTSAPQSVFLGPKEKDALAAFGRDSVKIVRYGMFGFFTEILFVSIRAIHKVIPNWGFAIIVLTFLIKIVFFPLTYSSSKSMAKMAELQPKIKSLRAKYKKSKTDIQQRREMNEEMMKLYKEHGVNPAGGCLPLLIQLPVFWGFFRLLTVGIEFRHSPWMLWIKDLSVHDPLYITPILMGATQFISQKMTPTSADPAQARMMLIMPVVMTLFFLNFQSGLVLYWLTSNVLQIGQQALMNKLLKRKKGEPHGKQPARKK